MRVHRTPRDSVRGPVQAVLGTDAHCRVSRLSNNRPKIQVFGCFRVLFGYGCRRKRKNGFDHAVNRTYVCTWFIVCSSVHLQPGVLNRVCWRCYVRTRIVRTRILRSARILRYFIPCFRRLGHMLRLCTYSLPQPHVTRLLRL